VTPDAPEFLRRMDAIAARLDPSTLDAELGAMCKRSLFFALRQGATVSQREIDVASHAFITATERLMPPGVLHGFIEHACSTRILPRIDEGELVPGFTIDEGLAGADASTRRAHPVKKFTQAEVLACLRWNQREPDVAVALAHLVDLIQTFAAALGTLAGRYSPSAEAMLGPFVVQWLPKNVLKFMNLAIYVCGTRRSGLDAFEVDQSLIVEAVTLLDKSGAFTWTAREDSGAESASDLRIHCPAQAFLHKLLANEGSLMTVLEYVRAEALRSPVEPDVQSSFAFVRNTAARELAGVTRFGAEWPNRSEQKPAGPHR